MSLVKVTVDSFEVKKEEPSDPAQGSMEADIMLTKGAYKLLRRDADVSRESQAPPGDCIGTIGSGPAVAAKEKAGTPVKKLRQSEREEPEGDEGG